MSSHNRFGHRVPTPAFRPNDGPPPVHRPSDVNWVDDETIEFVFAVTLDAFTDPALFVVQDVPATSLAPGAPNSIVASFPGAGIAHGAVWRTIKGNAVTFVDGGELGHATGHCT